MIILNSVDEYIMKEIHDNSFVLPDITNKMYICHKTVVDNGQVQAIGLVKITGEGILITNQTLPSISRARASKELILALKEEAKNKGLEDCHIFVKKEKVKRFMNHIGFRYCKGEAMVIDL